MIRADKKQKLKRSKSRKDSSTRWLQRQLNDPFVQEARKLGYRARSVFKLQEIDERFGLIRKGMRILDLGAAPGSWSQYAARKGAAIVAIDLLPVEPIDGVTILQGDFLDPVMQERLKEELGGPADLVLSDIAPDATGRRIVDRLRAEQVGETVLDFAAEVLRIDGHAFLKLVKGAEHAVMKSAQDRFRSFRPLRPKATRSESSEIFILASGRKPLPADPDQGADTGS
ncbi:MAG: RlmE family RNA methyltransferase [Geminicoccaceae bacterium]|nr:RlmE family RNA methyltransferase [Geminicoccaceae bacterium]